MSGEAESAGHNCFMHKLSNEAWHNFDRKECLISISVQYYTDLTNLTADGHHSGEKTRPWGLFPAA